MKGLLKGKISLGDREFETSFISAGEFIKSDYLLYIEIVDKAIDYLIEVLRLS